MNYVNGVGPFTYIFTAISKQVWVINLSQFLKGKIYICTYRPLYRMYSTELTRVLMITASILYTS